MFTEDGTSSSALVTVDGSVQGGGGAAATTRIQAYESRWTSADNGLYYVPWGTIEESYSIVDMQSNQMGDQYTGALLYVIVEASGGGGSTIIGLHIDGSVSAQSTVTETLSAGVSQVYDFTGVSNAITASTRWGLSFDTATAPTNVNLVAIVQWNLS